MSRKLHAELKSEITRLANKYKGSFTHRAQKIAKKLGIEYTDSLRKRVSEWADDGNRRKSDDSKPSEQFLQAKKHRIDGRKKFHIVTACQNATPVHKEFLDNMLAYANHLNADVHICALRYKNPTSVFTDKDMDWWADEVQPYLDASRHKIHPHMVLLSDVKTQLTAMNPLSGMQGLSALESCIIGHPKICLQSVPVLDGYPPKLLLSTGACTIPNYTDSAAGKKGEFHHQYGFVVVELVDDSKFHVRQVTADRDGTFHDLFYRVSMGEVTRNESCKAIVLGDLHVGEHDQQAVDTSLKLLKQMNPGTVVLHDVFSGYSISHHERNDPFIQAAREVDGTGSLSEEMENMVDMVERFLPWNPVIPSANHNIFLDRWLRDVDWRKYPNRNEYIKYAGVVLSGDAPMGIVAYELEKRFGKDIKCLGYNDSFRVGEWELGVHGDIGSSGSRGSINQYKTYNTKLITAHSHQPARQLNVLSVGTLTKLRLNYTKGASAWMHSNVILHNNDKAQHVHLFDGEYTTLK